MQEFKYIITDPDGIHARPAGELVAKAKEFISDISISKGGVRADCKRIFGVMGLAAKQGQEIILTFDGPDEKEACVALETFLKAKM